MSFNQAKTPKEYALNLLKLRDRSIGEIRQKMKLKKFSDAEIAEVIAFLTEKNFLDDERFARNYVRNQLLLKPQGKFKLKARLIQLFVSTEIIDTVLSEIDSASEKELAREAGERWLAKKNVVEEEKYEKLARYLSSRGFSWEVTKEVLGEILDPKS